jgi:polyhydroxyalkanoate synthesis regulator phasin
MKLRIALEEKLMDLRVRDRLVAEGKISKDDLKKYMDQLTDDSKNAVSMDQEETTNLQ